MKIIKSMAMFSYFDFYVLVSGLKKFNPYFSEGYSMIKCLM